jgi:hypothetical protein
MSHGAQQHQIILSNGFYATGADVFKGAATAKLVPPWLPVIVNHTKLEELVCIQKCKQLHYRFDWQSANKGSQVYMYYKTCCHGNVVVKTVQQSSISPHERR